MPTKRHCQSFSKNTTPLVHDLITYKKYKNGNSVTSPQRHIRPPIRYGEVTILVRDYPENNQKQQLKTSFSRERLINVSPRKAISHITLNPSRRCLTCGAKWTFCRTGPNMNIGKAYRRAQLCFIGKLQYIYRY